ncbi:MAG: transcriptional regulator [Halobacteriovoraceae bacterium]|nr:transcriptional regulator [Halobacteriovoraceae bacterium]
MKKGTDHSKNLARIKRVEGQIRGIANMVESERYCVDILTQIKAARSALKSLESRILEEHLNHCVKKAVKSKNSKESDEMVAELIEIFKKASQ